MRDLNSRLDRLEQALRPPPLCAVIFPAERGSRRVGTIERQPDGRPVVLAVGDDGPDERQRRLLDSMGPDGLVIHVGYEVRPLPRFGATEGRSHE